MSDRLKSTVTHVSSTITPPGKRPPFHEQYTPRKAFEWWMQHRYDPIGMKICEGWNDPGRVAQLDAWLTSAMQGLLAGAQHGVPLQSNQLPDANGILNRAMTQERRTEGPPIGDQVA